MEKEFIRNFLYTFLSLVVFTFGFIFIVDPWNVLHLSPALDREVTIHNQRASYPAAARSDKFNSLIIGTSTTRMIDPVVIDKPLHAKFANLSLNSGTWWEQMQMFQHFLKYHPKPKRIIWGMDVIWCSSDDTGRKLTPRPFPKWVYDDNQWNDYLFLLNFTMVEHSFEQLGAMMGFSKPRYEKSGYSNLNKKGTPYNIEKARKNIYKQITPIPPAAAIPVANELESKRKSWIFPNVEIIRSQLSLLPKSTEILLLFVPYHQHFQGPAGSKKRIQYDECKMRFSKLKSNFPNLKIIDFMFRSKFTLDDSLYWDSLHYNDKGAEILQKVVVDFWEDKKMNAEYAREIK